MLPHAVRSVLRRSLLSGQDDPDVGALVPGAAAVVAERGLDGETGALKAA